MHKYRLSPYTLASFLIPPFIFEIAMATFGIYPFGNFVLLTSDMDSQYIQFYKQFYDVLTQGKSLLYTWNAGMGLNFIGLIAYYLASPLAPLIVLFKSNHLPEAIVLITLTKIGISGLTMNIYLTKILPLKRINTLSFSIMYSLMGFSIAYSFDLMWLDGMYMLPLLLLGVERLLKGNQFIFFISVLAFSFLSNFYISYMMGIFTFLYFLVRYFTFYREKGKSHFLKKFVCFSKAATIAVGLSMFLILPTAFALFQTTKQPLKLHTLAIFNVNLIDLYMKLFPGFVDSLRTGTPNLYPGMLATLLFPTYFFIKKINLKERLIFGIFIAFFIVSFEIPAVNLAWHGFDSPNYFPYRYSFLLTFLILFVAVRAFQMLDRNSFWLLIAVYFIDLISIQLFKIRNPDFIPSLVPTVAVILLTMSFLLLLIKSVTAYEKSWIYIPMFILVCADMGINSFFTLKSIHEQFAYNQRTNYFANSSDIENVVQFSKKMDHNFYRTESAMNRNLNDSLRYGYYGISHFSSFSNIQLHRYLHDFGYSTIKSNLWASNNGSTLLTDSVLGIKYMISDVPFKRFGYKKIVCSNSVCLYENSNALPIGYLLNHTSFSMGSSNPFINQNKFFGSKNIFKEVQPDRIEYRNLAVSRKKRFLHIEKMDKNAPSFIQYRFSLTDNQQFYTLFSADRWNHTEIFIDGHFLGTYPTVFNNRILDLGAFSNKKVTIVVKLSGNQLTIKNPIFYALNISAFEKRIKELKSHPLVVKKWSETQISGEVNSADGGLLFLSIPYDPGWSAIVDGKPIKLLNIRDAFLGLPIKSGHHRIQLSYMPQGFKIGSILTIISLLIFAYLLIDQRKARKRNSTLHKYQ